MERAEPFSVTADPPPAERSCDVPVASSASQPRGVGASSDRMGNAAPPNSTPCSPVWFDPTSSLVLVCGGVACCCRDSAVMAMLAEHFRLVIDWHDHERALERQSCVAAATENESRFGRASSSLWVGS